MKLLCTLMLALCHICLVSSQDEPVEDLVIKPSFVKMWLLEGSPLTLKCEYTGSNARTYTIGFWRGTEAVNKGLGFTLTEKIETNEQSEDMKVLTIHKNSASLEDRGDYQCRYGTQLTTNIKIEVVTVTPGHAMYVEKATEANITCTLMNASMDPRTQLTVEWKKGNETLTVSGDSRFIAHGPVDMTSHNGVYTLEIKNPERTDAGEYFCAFIFSEVGADNPKFTLSPSPATFKAKPMIDSHDNNKNLVEGERLELKCLVSGYPVPAVVWKKDDNLVNTSDSRFHLFQYGPSDTGKLVVYSLIFADSGKYTCEGSATGFNETAMADMKVRVKDKLAALWPFLGIVAEVIILCAIIFIYEKRRSKAMNDEDDSPDTNAEKATANKDVRHRRS